MPSSNKIQNFSLRTLWLLVCLKFIPKSIAISNEIIPIFIAILLRFLADFRTLFVEQELLVVVRI